MLIQLETQCAKPKPRSVFYSYSHKDEDLRDELDTHLKLLKREGFISTWHDRKIRPGDEWDHVINENLNTAEVVLFLVSQHFLASQYCRDTEVRRAMERHDKREAIVIPIILRPCVWTTEAFAKLQALPKNCRPLVEWRDNGFAKVSEELRTMMVELLYPRMPDEKLQGQHGHWILKLKNRPGVDSQTRAQQLVSRLKEFTEDFSISLQATATTQIANGDKMELGLMLILTGTPEAFSQVSKAQADGILAANIDEDIISFYVIHGSTVQGSSTVGSSADLGDFNNEDLLLRPGRKIVPSHMKGLVLPNDENEGIHFIINRGDSDVLDLAVKRDEYQQLSDYFYSSLVVKDENQWVNLSAYESDRMLPPELSGTLMGRNLLSQDCMLKRLTASFMHPDSPIGREYWDAVYAEARRIFGTSKTPFRSFQKVWIVPIHAEVYEPTEEALKDNLITNFHPNAAAACYVIKQILDVQCEEDLIAKKHGVTIQSPASETDFTLALFREIVLPKIKEEVNEGEHFAEIRRIYTMILTAWLKRTTQKIRNKKIRELVDSGKTTTRMVISDIRPVKGSKTTAPIQSPPQRITETKPVDHATPTSPAFNVPENVEFYGQYVKLFKNGVFRCARNEAGDAPDERVIRVYFSGAIVFRNLSNVIRNQTSGPT